MLVTSSSDTSFFETAARGRFEMRAAPFPVRSGGSLPAGGNGAMIHASDPSRQKLAFDFIDFASSAEAQALLAERTGYLPGNAQALADTGLRRFYASHPNLSVAAEQMPLAGRWFAFPGENSSKIVTVIEDEMRDVLLLKKEPADALHHLSVTVQGFLG
jgi:multiple sugar transport system substrate-binding protein